MYLSFDEYYRSIKQRNNETHADGHMVAFNFDEMVLDNNIDFFHNCWIYQLSPHKALTFLDFERSNGE